MQSTTATLNACQHILDGRLADVDFPALKTALESAPLDKSHGHRTMLLTLCAQSHEPGAVAALRDHNIIPPAGKARLSHAALRDIHTANAVDVATLLDEDIHAIRQDPIGTAQISEQLWVWQMHDAPIRKALLILGLRPLERRTDNSFPFKWARWRFALNAVQKAALSLTEGHPS